MRVEHRPGVAPADSTGEIAGKIRFHAGDIGRSQAVVLHPEFILPKCCLRKSRVALGLRAEKLDPAILADQRFSLRRFDQVLVFGNRIFDQRRIGPGDERVAARIGVPPVAGEKGDLARQRAQVIMRIDAVIQRITQQKPELLGKAVRRDTFALDQAGIAEGGFVARILAVDQRHLPPRR